MVDGLSRLLFGHALFQPLEPLLGGLFDKRHVFCQVLLGGDLALLASFELIEPKLGDDRAVLQVQLFPHFGAP